MLVLVGAGCSSDAPVSDADVSADLPTVEALGVPVPGFEGVVEEAVVESDLDSAAEKIPQDLPATEPVVVPEPAPVSEVTAEPTPEPVVEVKPVVKSFNITAKQWDFVPSTITVNKGDTVKLSITSADVTHGFRLAAFGVNENLSPGSTVHVEFVADKVGNHSFICSVFCGHGHSVMSGTLIVK